MFLPLLSLFPLLWCALWSSYRHCMKKNMKLNASIIRIRGRGIWSGGRGREGWGGWRDNHCSCHLQLLQLLYLARHLQLATPLRYIYLSLYVTTTLHLPKVSSISSFEKYVNVGIMERVRKVASLSSTQQAAFSVLGLGDRLYIVAMTMPTAVEPGKLGFGQNFWTGLSSECIKW